MKIPYHKPIIPKNINSLFSESIRAGWLTTGPIAKQFEDELAKYLNAKNKELDSVFSLHASLTDAKIILVRKLIIHLMIPGVKQL